MQELKNKVRITSIIIAIVSILYIVIYGASNNVIVVNYLLIAFINVLDLIPDNDL